MEEARSESADEICRGLDMLILEGCVRPKLFSGRDRELRAEDDMGEHTEDGWEGAMVQGRGGLCAFTPESILGH